MGQKDMTVKDIFKAIALAPADKKVEVAEKMLDQYDGFDKELIAPDILSHAMLVQSYPDDILKS